MAITNMKFNPNNYIIKYIFSLQVNTSIYKIMVS